MNDITNGDRKAYGVQHTGGSPAAQALREQLAREGRDQSLGSKTPVSNGNSNSGVTNSADSRTTARKKVSGKVTASFSGQQRTGKFVDLSVNGACILFEDRFPIKTQCNISCDVFMSGKRFVFSTNAVSIYAILAGGYGVKVGFQFGAHDDTCEKQSSRYFPFDWMIKFKVKSNSHYHAPCDRWVSAW